MPPEDSDTVMDWTSLVGLLPQIFTRNLLRTLLISGISAHGTKLRNFMDQFMTNTYRETPIL